MSEESSEVDPTAVLSTIAAAVADCKAQTRALEVRKASLLVELATISDSLEDMYNSRVQLTSMAEDMLEDISDSLGADAAAEAQRQFQASSSQPPPAHAASEPPAEPTTKPQRPKAKSNKQASKDRKAARLAMALPTDAAACDALKRRQIVVRGLPPGRFDEAGLAALLCAAFSALPAFRRGPSTDVGDPASGGADLSAKAGTGDEEEARSSCACQPEDVRMYAGGGYAFVAMRDPSLAATAPLLPPIVIEGTALRLSRTWEFDADTSDVPLPVPSTLDLSRVLHSLSPAGCCSSVCSSASSPASSPATRAASTRGSSSTSASSLESRLYWSLRLHRAHPKPNLKEVREAIAFVKKAEKLLGRRKLVIDCCGSHGLVGAALVAFGRAEEAAILDLHRPGSFDQVCEAWGAWLGCKKDGAKAEVQAAPSPSPRPPSPQQQQQPQQQAHERPQREEVEETASPIVAEEAAHDGRRVGCAVHFQTGDFHATLPAALDAFLSGGGAASQVCVVACHACT